MSGTTGQKPHFSEQMECCIAVAKGIAAKEGVGAKLDPLHLVIAAIRTAPEAARAAFDKTGHSWQQVQTQCPEVKTDVSAEVSEKPMFLVRELRNVISNLSTHSNRGNRNAPIETGELLTLILQNPSIRLREFLRRIRRTNTTKDKEAKETADPPYRSFREYLTARRELWSLRQMAWGAVEKYSKHNGEKKQMLANQRHQERLLSKLARLEGQSARRAETSTTAAIPLRQIGIEYQLLPLQAELIEGLLLHELYGTLGPFDIPLSAREIAQMIAPETYPRNCLKVIEALTGLEKHGLVKLSERNDERCTPSSRAWLKPDILANLLACLANDIIDDTDVKAARRQLYESATWPL